MACDRRARNQQYKSPLKVYVGVDKTQFPHASEQFSSCAIFCRHHPRSFQAIDTFVSHFQKCVYILATPVRPISWRLLPLTPPASKQVGLLTARSMSES